MKKNTMTRLLSVVMVLAMLLGTLTALSIGSGVSAETVPNPTIDEVDEFRIVTPNYQSNWAGSTIANKYGSYSVVADGAYNGALMWTVADAATIDADGILSFAATGTDPYLSFRPYQNGSHNVKAGPIRIAFDIYYDENTPNIKYETNGLSWLFHINGDGNLYINKNKWWEPSKVKVDTLVEGWNTIEIILIPELADKTISTVSTDTIASNQLYIRSYATGSVAAVSKYTSSQLALDFYHTALPTEDNKHFIQSICNGAYIKITDKSETEGVDVLKIRGAQAMNLELYVAPTGDPVVSFAGHPALTQIVANGTVITIPEAEGVKSWLSGSNYYIPGESYTVTGHTEFLPVTNEGYVLKCGLNSQNAWGSSASDNSWGTISSTSALIWYKAADGTKTYTYNGTEKTLTISSGAAKAQSLNIYPMRTSPSGAYTGAMDFIIEMEILYTEGDFDGFVVDCNWGWNNLVRVSADGKAAFTSGSEIGQLTEGWNIFRLYFVANRSDENAYESYEMYGELNRDLGTRSMMDADELAALPHKNWKRSAAFSGDNDLLHIYTNDANATVENPTSLTLRKIKTYSMTPTAYNTIAVENFREMYTIPTGENFTIPTISGIDKWVAIDNTTGVATLADSDAVIPVTTDYTVIGAAQDASKFGRASISLGSEMILNMKVNPDVLHEGTVDRMMAFAEGTAINAMADAGFDDYGYYNIPITGILARDMWKDLNLYLLTEIDGNYYLSTNVQVYSPLIYIQKMYEKSTDEVKTLLAAMANYGAAAEESYYTGSTNMRTAMNSLGITGDAIPALPEDSTTYADPSLTANKEILNKYVQTGATLSSNLSLVLDPLTAGQLKGVRVASGAWSETYEVGADGKIVIDGMNAGAIRNAFTITFIGADGADIESTTFSIGNFLELKRASTETKALAEATIIYMMQVRAYVLATGM